VNSKRADSSNALSLVLLQSGLLEFCYWSVESTFDVPLVVPFHI